MPEFAVLLHAKNLLVADDHGATKPGGMYTWRCISASSSDEAAAIASHKLISEEELRDEVWNRSLDDITIVAEEIQLLELSDDNFYDSGYVFYIEEPE